MGNNGVKAIIFDLGRVLVDFDHTIAARRIAAFSDKSPEEIFNLFFDSPATYSFEQGKISPQDFFLQVKKMLNLKLNYEQFLPIWNEIFFLSEKNRQVYALAKKLKSRYTIAVLSNVNRLHFQYLKEKFPVFDIFHQVFASCDLGLIKPDPLIYKKALSLLGVGQPQEAFYTDDRPELVSQAEQLGIKAALFRGFEQLQRDLSSAGVKID